MEKRANHVSSLGEPSSCPSLSSDDLSLKKSAIATGLVFAGIGAISLGAGFLGGLSRAKKKVKGDMMMMSSFNLEKEGATLARRALAYGSMLSFCGVGSLLFIGAYLLDIRSLTHLREISRAPVLERNSLQKTDHKN